MNKTAITIVGNGPAGVSTALYTARAGIETLVIGFDEGALSQAKEIENYYGFPSPISGQDLLDRGISQIERLGVKVIEQEVVAVEEVNNNFIVKTASEQFDSQIVPSPFASNTKFTLSSCT